MAPAASDDVAPAPERFARGRVAYLRCDGLPLRKGPFPCPRDREFEQRVWSALEALSRCPQLASQRGSSEVRFDVRGDEATVRVADGTLDSDAVGACAGAGLRAIRTALRPTRMIVSFRFALR